MVDLLVHLHFKTGRGRTKTFHVSVNGKSGEGTWIPTSILKSYSECGNGMIILRMAQSAAEFYFAKPLPLLGDSVSAKKKLGIPNRL